MWLEIVPRATLGFTPKVKAFSHTLLVKFHQFFELKHKAGPLS